MGIRIIEVIKWAIVDGFVYDVHLPEEFTLEGEVEDIKAISHFHFLTVFHGPCRDKWGSHHFFDSGYDESSVEVLESEDAITVCFNGRGKGREKSAVYKVLPVTELKTLWRARLVEVVNGKKRYRY